MKLYTSLIRKRVFEEILRFKDKFLYPLGLFLQPFSMYRRLPDLTSQGVKNLVGRCGKCVNRNGIIPSHPEPDGRFKLRMCSALLTNKVFSAFWLGHSAYSGQQAIFKQVGTSVCNQSPTGFTVIILAEEMNHLRLP
jgi:hypothetical protein